MRRSFVGTLGTLRIRRSRHPKSKPRHARGFFFEACNMKRFALVVLVIVGAALLSACAASRKDFYDAQNDYREQIAARDSAKAAALQTAASGCTDDSCRIAIAGFAALARGETVAAPQQYRSEASGLLNLVDRAIGIGGQVYGQKLQADSLVDLAGVIADSAGDRSTHSYIDQSDHSDNSVSIADSYNSDDDTSGDTIADSNNGDHIGRDLIGGDRTDNSGNIGSDNRQDSPGPIDNSDDGNDCSGSSCNPVEPEPEP